MSRLVFNQVENTPVSTPVGATMLYVKQDGGVYAKNASDEEILILNPSADVNSIIRTNAQTISESITLSGNVNGLTTGPITIGNGYSVTVVSGSNWKII